MADLQARSAYVMHLDEMHLDEMQAGRDASWTRCKLDEMQAGRDAG